VTCGVWLASLTRTLPGAPPFAPSRLFLSANFIPSSFEANFDSQHCAWEPKPLHVAGLRASQTLYSETSKERTMQISPPRVGRALPNTSTSPTAEHLSYARTIRRVVHRLGCISTIRHWCIRFYVQSATSHVLSYPCVPPSFHSRRGELSIRAIPVAAFPRDCCTFSIPVPHETPNKVI
jgi:hypothetical protein